MKVSYYDICDNWLDNGELKPKYHTKTIKNKTIARIYIFLCRVFHDYVEVEEEMKENERWCYGCGEIKPLDHEHFAWANKEHTKFRNKCRKCTNFDSKISHRIHRKDENNSRRD